MGAVIVSAFLRPRLYIHVARLLTVNIGNQAMQQFSEYVYLATLEDIRTLHRRPWIRSWQRTAIVYWLAHVERHAGNHWISASAASSSAASSHVFPIPRPRNYSLSPCAESLLSVSPLSSQHRGALTELLNFICVLNVAWDIRVSLVFSSWQR